MYHNHHNTSPIRRSRSPSRRVVSSYRHRTLSPIPSYHYQSRQLSSTAAGTSTVNFTDPWTGRPLTPIPITDRSLSIRDHLNMHSPYVSSSSSNNHSTISTPPEFRERTRRSNGVPPSSQATPSRGTSVSTRNSSSRHLRDLEPSLLSTRDAQYRNHSTRSNTDSTISSTASQMFHNRLSPTGNRSEHTHYRHNSMISHHNIPEVMSDGDANMNTEADWTSSESSPDGIETLSGLYSSYMPEEMRETARQQNRRRFGGFDR